MRTVLIALAALGLAGCGVFGGSDKPKESLKPAPLPKITPQVEVKRQWDYDVGASVGERYVQLRPVLTGETLYAADPEGRVTALAVADGKPRWRIDLETRISGGLGSGEGLILLGTPDAEVIAVDSRDGRELWRQRVSSEVLAAPVAGAGIVVARTIDGGVFGLSTVDGQRKWSYRREVPSLSLRGSSPAVLRQGVALVGFADGKIVATDMATGNRLWDFGIAQPRGRNEVERMIDIDAEPLLMGSALYASAFQGRLVAMSLGTRRVMWVKELSSYAGFGVDEESLYVASEQDHLVALDRLSGATRWRQELLQRRRLSGPVAVDDWVVTGDYEGYLHVIDKTSGKLVGRTRLGGGAILTRPLVAAGTVYALTSDGELTAVKITPRGG